MDVKQNQSPHCNNISNQRLSGLISEPLTGYRILIEKQPKQPKDIHTCLNDEVSENKIQSYTLEKSLPVAGGRTDEPIDRRRDSMSSCVEERFSLHLWHDFSVFSMF